MFLQDVSEVTIPEALVHTGISMGIVFTVLILISFIIFLLKFVPVLLSGEKKKKAASSGAAPVKTAETPGKAPVSTSSVDNSQIVAVIAAAIAAQMEEETGVKTAADGLVIRSIKKRTFSN
ncbi:MAG: OadG family protein [Lachnospiraceae bacterium]|nr:OadG family protein [Lachnospiraceae bacterium]